VAASKGRPAVAPWALANALRECMTFANQSDALITYKQAITLGKQMAPVIFNSPKRCLDNPPESSGARLFREKEGAPPVVEMWGGSPGHFHATPD
jgi:hypothetical protein